MKARRLVFGQDDSDTAIAHRARMMILNADHGAVERDTEGRPVALYPAMPGPSEREIVARLTAERDGDVTEVKPKARAKR